MVLTIKIETDFGAGAEITTEITRKLLRDFEIAIMESVGDVKRAMPYDEGVARASFGSDAVGQGIRRDGLDAYIARLEQGFGKGIKIEGLAAEISGVHYIEYLEQGHSKQAPSGFIKSIFERHLARIGR